MWHGSVNQVTHVCNLFAAGHAAAGHVFINQTLTFNTTANIQGKTIHIRYVHILVICRQNNGQNTNQQNHFFHTGSFAKI